MSADGTDGTDGEVIAVSVTVLLAELASTEEPVPSWAAASLLRMAEQARVLHADRAAAEREEPVGREVVQVTVTVKQAYRPVEDTGGAGAEGDGAATGSRGSKP